MDKIPDDVMKAAREAAAKQYVANGFSAGTGIVPRFLLGEEDDREAIQVAARAIRAERERIAGEAYLMGQRALRGMTGDIEPEKAAYHSGAFDATQSLLEAIRKGT